MINVHAINGFADEIEKIALAEELGELGGLARRAGGGLKKWVQTGWEKPMGMFEHASKQVPHATKPGKMVEQKVFDSAGTKVWNERPNAQWTGRGNVTKYLPVGDKSLNAAAVGMMVPGAVSKEDSTGEGRSRAERISGLVGGTAGMFAGQGAMAHLPMKGLGVTRSIVGGLGGSLIGERMATSPFRHTRKAEMPAQNPEELPNAAPGRAA